MYDFYTTFSYGNLGVQRFTQGALYYRYRLGNGIERIVPVVCNEYVWAKKSVGDRDLYSTLAQTYGTLTGSPVTGISADQAIAFCHWKQEQLQQQLDKAGLPYRVNITLPESLELQQLTTAEPVFTVPASDPERWKITAENYAAFMNDVRDSLLREYLYEHLREDKMAAQYLVLPKKGGYFDGVETVSVIDHSDRDDNRYHFPLNRAAKIPQKDIETQELIAAFQKSQAYLEPSYHYMHTDAHRRADSANWMQSFFPDSVELYYYGYFGPGLKRSPPPSPRIRPWNITTEWYYCDKEVVAITPRQPDLGLSTARYENYLSYEQAMAFWHWKHDLDKRSSDQPWQSFILPSETQFKQLQSGETIVQPEMQLPYPAPLFRYVVHVYP